MSRIFFEDLCSFVNIQIIVLNNNNWIKYCDDVCRQHIQPVVSTNGNNIDYPERKLPDRLFKHPIYTSTPMALWI